MINGFTEAPRYLPSLLLEIPHQTSPPSRVAVSLSPALVDESFLLFFAPQIIIFSTSSMYRFNITAP